MPKITKLRRPAASPLDGLRAETAVGERAIRQAQLLAVARIDAVLAALERELIRIAELRRYVEDPEIAEKLDTEHATLAAAVRDAKQRLETYKGTVWQ